MSGEKDTRKHESTGRARRTYRSLREARGFRHEPWDSDTTPRCSIRPMECRSFWRFVGTGKWNAADALYEEE